jgi:phytoene dehydrogenase-like protein
MQREIDCLIVGSGMGSMTCGTVLAQRGWRVLLLTRDTLEDSFYGIHDAFEHERSPDLLWGLEEGGFLRPLLATEEEPPVVRLQPGVQVVLPGHRVGLYGPGPDWERELRREFSSSWRESLACAEDLCQLSEVIWAGMGMSRWTMARWRSSRLGGTRHLRTFLRGRGITPPFCNMTEAVAAACFGVEPSQTTVAMAAVAFGHARNGLFAARGGAKGFIERLTRRFQAFKGEIRSGAVREITIKWNKIREVVTAEGGVVCPRYVVWEPDPASQNQILHLVVDEALIPGEMGRNVLLVEAESSGEAPSGLLHLALGVVGDADGRPSRKRALAIRILRAPRHDPVNLLDQAFPGWARVEICPVPPRQGAVGFPLAPRRLRPRNLAVISAESALGCGLSAAAWNGHRIATRLLGRT